jgi:hypothetical protein
MEHRQRWAALAGVLALLSLAPSSAEAQARDSRSSRDPVSGATLGQNFPNPFTTETTIPFTIGSWPECADPGRQYRVSLRVYNLLAQLVAVPVLTGGSSGASTGQPLRDVMLTCGEYTAYWDGSYSDGSRNVSSGVYLYHLEVDRRPLVKKLVVMK